MEFLWNSLFITGRNLHPLSYPSKSWFCKERASMRVREVSSEIVSTTVFEDTNRWNFDVVRRCKMFLQPHKARHSERLNNRVKKKKTNIIAFLRSCNSEPEYSRYKLPTRSKSPRKCRTKLTAKLGKDKYWMIMIRHRRRFDDSKGKRTLQRGIAAIPACGPAREIKFLTCCQRWQIRTVSMKIKRVFTRRKES